MARLEPISNTVAIVPPVRAACPASCRRSAVWAIALLLTLVMSTDLALVAAQDAAVVGPEHSVAEPSSGDPAPPSELSGLGAAFAIEAAIVKAVETAQSSVVAIARVRTELLEGNGASRQATTPPALAARSILPTDPDFVPNEYGAGVVIGAQGLILTNYHLLGNPQLSKYFVWVQQRPFSARVIAADPWYDLAVLKIEARRLEPITFAADGDIKKGQIVLALGNPEAIARDGAASVSWGIVSNVLRRAPTIPPRPVGEVHETIHQYGTLIQTDARLNAGYSGGALINLQGQMVGLTTSLTAGVGFEKAAGFAVPVDAGFRRVVGALRQGRKPDFGFLGVAPENNKLALRQRGVWGANVVEVYDGTPAAQAGVKIGDLIVVIDGQPVFGDHDLIRLVSSQSPGSVISLGIIRENSVGQLLAGGTVRPRQVEVRLSKKYVSASRPQIGAAEVVSWRGLIVDYVTAVEDFREVVGRIDPLGCVAVMDVAADSAAWLSGLRAGDLISQVNQEQVSTPAEFLDRVAAAQDTVALRVITNAGEVETRAVERQTAE